MRPKSHSTFSESQCRFVSSRGLLKSCNLHVKIPESAMRKIPGEFAIRIGPNAKSIYMTPDMLEPFVRYHMWRIRKPFNLITGDSVMPIEGGIFSDKILNSLLENARLQTWFAQNLAMKHGKLKHLPLGLDYHTLSQSNYSGEPHNWGDFQAPMKQEQQLMQINYDAGSISGKLPLAYSNWHFAANRGNRQECLAQTPAEVVYYQPNFLPRIASWNQNAQYAFTLSPIGVGLDCHRTWEAILLGTIPIVFQSALDPLFDGLPVLIIRNWREITKERLITEQRRLSAKKFDFSQVELAHWAAKIHNLADIPSKMMSIEEFRVSLQSIRPAT